MASTTCVWIPSLASIALFLAVFIETTYTIRLEDLPSVEVMRQRELDARADARCVLCKFVMEEIDNYLTGPKVREFLKEEFIPSCKKYIPFEAEKVCHVLADLLDDALSEVIYSEMSPEAACERVKMCPKETFAEANQIKMPHSNIAPDSENYLCDMCQEITKSALKLSIKVLEEVSKDVTEYCSETPLNENSKAKCTDVIHEAIHKIIDKLKTDPLEHKNLCVESLKACKD